MVKRDGKKRLKILPKEIRLRVRTNIFLKGIFLILSSIFYVLISTIIIGAIAILSNGWTRFILTTIFGIWLIIHVCKYNKYSKRLLAEKEEDI